MIVIGSILYALSHAGVQLAARRDGLVPLPWTLATLIVDLAPAAILLGLGHLWAWPVLLIGILSVPVALHVAAQRRAHADRADLGARELEARRMLRRATPEERRRVLEPRTGSVDLDQLAQMAREARRGMSDLVVREGGRPPRAA